MSSKDVKITSHQEDIEHAAVEHSQQEESKRERKPRAKQAAPVYRKKGEEPASTNPDSQTQDVPKDTKVPQKSREKSRGHPARKEDATPQYRPKTPKTHAQEGESTEPEVEGNESRKTGEQRRPRQEMVYRPKGEAGAEVQPDEKRSKSRPNKQMVYKRKDEIAKEESTQQEDKSAEKGKKDR